jgi:hypothetical protein
VPLIVRAGAVNGVAVAMAHEGEVERCFVAALPVKEE